MKKIISLILCLCSVFGILSVPCCAEEAPFYSLTFNANGGVFDNGEETKVFYLHEGDAVSDILPPERTAYEFKGWNKKLPEKMPANNLAFSAVWEAIPGADPEDGKIPVEKVELNIYINRVYVDVPVSSCLIEGSVPKNSVYYFSETLQKNINGEWTENFTKDYYDEIIGAGKYRWKVKFDVNWKFFDKYKTAPNVTKAYIDGKSYGTLDSDCAVYTNPFEITEKDKRPETKIIKELKADGFKEPKVGEVPQLELKIPENCGYTCYLFWTELTDEGVWSYDENISAFKSNARYFVKFIFNPINSYYSLSSYTKVYINGVLIEQDGVLGAFDLSFVLTEHAGVLGFFESIILYIKMYFNSFLFLIKFF